MNHVDEVLPFLDNHFNVEIKSDQHILSSEKVGNSTNSQLYINLQKRTELDRPKDFSNDCHIEFV